MGYGGFNSCFEAFNARIRKYLEPNKENIPLLSRKKIYKEKFKENKELHFYNEKPIKRQIFPSFGYVRLVSRFDRTN